MVSSTRCLVDSETKSGRFSTFDTVPTDTPATRATSLMLALSLPTSRPFPTCILPDRTTIRRQVVAAARRRGLSCQNVHTLAQPWFALSRRALQAIGVL